MSDVAFRVVIPIANLGALSDAIHRRWMRAIRALAAHGVCRWNLQTSTITAEGVGPSEIVSLLQAVALGHDVGAVLDMLETT